MEILRYLASPLSASRHVHNRNFEETEPTDNNQDDTAGSEWVEVDEPVGIIRQRIKRQRQLLQLDQVHHVLHYDKYRRFMRIQNIALITAVEEVDDDGRFQWWMSIQDTCTVQVWIVHFASLYHLQSWVSLLRSVTAATHTPALISDVVLSNTACPQKFRVTSSSSTKETILEMSPEQE